jgi:MoaA/NifB/PqqE/SkfB family radical SAM enzyme
MQELNFVWLELTKRCNLSCIHCYCDADSESPVSPLPVSYWKEALEDASRNHCKSVQFVGGEVLLVPHLSDLAHYAASLGFSHIELFSNLTTLSKTLIEDLPAGHLRFATSFYSSEPRVHDRITGQPGSWKRTVSAIKLLLQHSIPLRVGVVHINDSQDNLATVQFLQELGVSIIGTDQVRSIGRATRFLAPSTYQNDLCGGCGKNRVCISNTGTIFPCVMARHTPLGEYPATSLSEALNSESLDTFRSGFAPDHADVCQPFCWPNGGCSPHDRCTPTSTPCTPRCWPHGGPP